MPNTVIAKHPNKCIVNTQNPFNHLSLKNNSTTSEEKEENVVSDPKKPVIKNNRHSELICGNCQKSPSNAPIIKQPSKLAIKVPRANEENKGLNNNPITQRNDAPNIAPQLMNNKACINNLIQIEFASNELPIHLYLSQLLPNLNKPFLNEYQHLA